MQQILGNLHLVSIIAISIAMSGTSKKGGEMRDGHSEEPRD